MEWRQLNYGQGEGQVLIDGCEWGFYWFGVDAEFVIMLHDGEISLTKAVEFVQSVAQLVVSPGVAIEIKLKERKPRSVVEPPPPKKWWQFW